MDSDDIASVNEEIGSVEECECFNKQDKEVRAGPALVPSGLDLSMMGAPCEQLELAAELGSKP